MHKKFLIVNMLLLYNNKYLANETVPLTVPKQKGEVMKMRSNHRYWIEREERERRNEMEKRWFVKSAKSIALTTIVACLFPFFAIGYKVFRGDYLPVETTIRKVEEGSRDAAGLDENGIREIIYYNSDNRAYRLVLYTGNPPNLSDYPTRSPELSDYLKR